MRNSYLVMLESTLSLQVLHTKQRKNKIMICLEGHQFVTLVILPALLAVFTKAMLRKQHFVFIGTEHLIQAELSA